MIVKRKNLYQEDFRQIYEIPLILVHSNFKSDSDKFKSFGANELFLISERVLSTLIKCCGKPPELRGLNDKLF